MFLLVPAYPGSPGPKAVKRLCVCVCVCNGTPITAVLTALPPLHRQTASRLDYTRLLTMTQRYAVTAYDAVTPGRVYCYVPRLVPLPVNNE